MTNYTTNTIYQENSSDAYVYIIFLLIHNNLSIKN